MMLLPSLLNTAGSRLLPGKATSYTLWFDTLMSSDDAGEYLTLLQSLFAGDLKPEEFAASMDKQLSKK